MKRIGWFETALIAAWTLAAPLGAQNYTPPEHKGGPPAFLTRSTEQEVAALADSGMTLEMARAPGWELAQQQRLATELAALKPQRPGVVDAYVVVVALDSDPVFGREAREAAKVLERRYGATGHVIVLAGTDGSAPSALPMGSPPNIEAALARVAGLMDKQQDVLVFYSTSHGAPFGIVYQDEDNGFGVISPARMASTLRSLGIRNALMMISACYSGVFIPQVADANRVILTAASSKRPSFGCQSDNDWTFFGDALINHALRKQQPINQAFDEARTLIDGWEKQGSQKPSNPQVSIGADTGKWLAALDAMTPGEPTQPVGKPATAALSSAPARR